MKILEEIIEAKNKQANENQNQKDDLIRDTVPIVNKYYKSKEELYNKFNFNDDRRGIE